MDTNPPHRQANNFDFLRLFAASAVVVGHSFWLSGNADLELVRRFTGHSDMADIAVNLFFVMSGYLIAASWLNSRSLVDFIGKRALRIFPALWVSVLFCVLVVGVLATHQPVREYLQDSRTAVYLSNMLLVTQFHLPGVFEANPFPDTVNGSLWTLPYEVLMYASVVMLGLCGLFGRRAVLLVLLAAMATHFLLIPLLDIQNQHLYKASRLGMFYFAGTLLYLYRTQIPWNWRIAALLLALTLVTGGSAWWFLVHVLTLPYLAIYLAQAPIPLLAGSGRYGDFSYGVYIFSFPLQQLIMLNWPGLPIPLFILVSLAVSLVLAALSWHFVEAPALSLKRYLPRLSLPRPVPRSEAP